MSLWTAADAARATGGQTAGGWQAGGVSIDSRSLAPGDLFVALTAARDGHDFVARALQQGAAAAMVSRLPEGVDPARLLVVDDVLAGLEALGRAGRARSRARVVAVTGSVGKTSTKDMLRLALSSQGATHAAEKSFNNHWGVPLTLARLPQDADFAVIEIGMNHPGEIAPLARMARPHVAMITTIAAAHLEAFASLDGIAREKAAIFEGLEEGGTAVVNGDLPVSAILIDAARARGAQVLTFGEAPDNDHRLADVRLTRDGTTATAHAGHTPLQLELATPGRHFAANALGVLAVTQALGADLDRVLTALSAWMPPEGRGTREALVLDRDGDALRIDLIDDAFNANPASMAAGLETLAAAVPADGGRRIAVLGDMLELGPDETGLHAALADLPALRAVALVHCVGPRMRALHAALDPGQRGSWTASAEDLAARAGTLAEAGDVLLVKGSKGSRVSLVVDALRKLRHRAAGDAEGGS